MDTGTRQMGTGENLSDEESLDNTGTFDRQQLLDLPPGEPTNDVAKVRGDRTPASAKTENGVDDDILESGELNLADEPTLGWTALGENEPSWIYGPRGRCS